MPAALKGICWGTGRLFNSAFSMHQDDWMGDGQWSNDGTQVVEAIMFEGGANFWDNLRTVIRTILGTNTWNGAGGINRTLPAAHPAFLQLTADRITSVRGLGFLGKDPGTRLGTYQRGVVWVVFGSHRYSTLSDVQIGQFGPGNNGDETKRWFIRESDTSTYFVNMQGIQYKFLDPPDEFFSGTMGKREAERIMLWTAYDWPINAVISRQGAATNFDAVAGRVNKFDFQSFAAGTLLAEPAKLRYKLAGVAPQDMGLGAFDAPILVDITVPIRLCLTRPGHNYLPRRGGGYGIAIAGIPAKPVYEEIDYNNYLFKPLGN